MAPAHLNPWMLPNTASALSRCPYRVELQHICQSVSAEEGSVGRYSCEYWRQPEICPEVQDPVTMTKKMLTEVWADPTLHRWAHVARPGRAR